LAGGDFLLRCVLGCDAVAGEGFSQQSVRLIAAYGKP